MKIEELDEVTLTVDLPLMGLRVGDAGVVVHLHSDGEHAEVEFFDVDRATTRSVETVALRDLIPTSLLRLLAARQFGAIKLQDPRTGDPASLACAIGFLFLASATAYASVRRRETASKGDRAFDLRVLLPSTYASQLESEAAKLWELTSEMHLLSLPAAVSAMTGLTLVGNDLLKVWVQQVVKGSFVKR